MKYSWVLAGALSAFLSLTPLAKADLFKNQNKSCNSVGILTSIRPDNFSLGDAHSVSCSKGFDNSGLTHCAVAASKRLNQGTPVFSLLFNRGTTSCGPTESTFETPLNYLKTGVALSSGNIVVGDMNGDEKADVVFSAVEDNVTERFIQHYFNLGGGFGPTNSVLTPLLTTVKFQNRNQTFRQMNGVENQGNPYNRGTVLLDCDRTHHLSAAILVGEHNAGGPSQLRLNILKNNGASLDEPSISLGFDSYNEGESIRTSIATGDFNQDGLADLTFLFDDGTNSPRKKSFLVTCLNQGSCSFDTDHCSRIDLLQANGKLVQAQSIAVGKFFKDGLEHIAVSQANLENDKSEIVVFKNQGMGQLSPNPAVSIFLAETGMRDSDLKTGCFDYNNEEDLAVTLKSNALPRAIGGVKIISFKGEAPQLTPLNFDVQATDFVHSNSALEVANLSDKTDSKGHDLVVLGTLQKPDGTKQRRAFTFIRENPLLSAVAGTYNRIQVGQELKLSGTCSLNPADASAEYETHWEIVEGDAASATFTGERTSTPTFKASKPGSYLLRLNCTTSCDMKAQSLTTIEVKNDAGLPAEDRNFNHFDQIEGSGPCSLNPKSPFSWGFFSLLPLFALFSLVRMVRK